MPNQDWWLVFRTKKEGNAPKQVADEMKELKGGLVGAIEGFTGFNVAQVGVAAGLAAVGKGLRDSLDATVKYASQVRDLSRASGASAEDTSRLIQTTDDLKISYETLTQASKKLATEGIALTTDELANLADQYVKIQDPADRLNFAIEKFGKNAGPEMAKALEVGGAALREMAAAQSDAMILTQQQVDAAREYEKALDDLDDRVNAVKYSIGTGLVNALVKAYDAFRRWEDAPETFKKVEKAAAETSQTYYEYSIRAIEAARDTGQISGSLADTIIAHLKASNAVDNLTRDLGDLSDETIAAAVANGTLNEELALQIPRLVEMANKSETMMKAQGLLAKEGWNVTQALKDTRAAAQVTAAGFDEFASSVGASQPSMKAWKATLDSIAKDSLARLNLEMQNYTANMLFNQAAAGLDAQAQRELAAAMGLIQPATATALNILDSMKAGMDRGQYMAGVYAQQVAALNRAINEMQDKHITITTDMVTRYQSYNSDEEGKFGEVHYATGGSYVVPPGYYENYPVGMGRYASSGEKVTITPKGDKTAAASGVNINGPIYIQSPMDLETFKRMLMQVMG